MWIKKKKAEFSTNIVWPKSFTPLWSWDKPVFILLPYKLNNIFCVAKVHMIYACIYEQNSCKKRNKWKDF